MLTPFKRGRFKARDWLHDSMLPVKYFQDLSFFPFRQGEVPYRLNVVTGNIALSSIAGSALQALALGNKYVKDQIGAVSPAMSRLTPVNGTGN
jgi:hypothetical protein